MLAGLRKEVVVVLDNDTAGVKGRIAAVHRLWERGAQASQASLPEEFKDVGEMSREEVLRWWRRREELLDGLDEMFGEGRYAPENQASRQE
jgi:hypothetical protein